MRWVGYALIAVGLAVASVGAAAIPPAEPESTPAGATTAATAMAGTAATGTAAPAPSTEDRVHWPLFLIGFALLGAGVVLIQVERRRSLVRAAATEEGTPDSDGAGGALHSLRRVKEAVAKLESEIETLSNEDILAAIDKLLLGDLLHIGQVRQQVADRLGPTAYAEMMSEFAVAERYLNRTWSAVADGYNGEGARSVRISAPAFATALKRFEDGLAAASKAPKPSQ